VLRLFTAAALAAASTTAVAAQTPPPAPPETTKAAVTQAGPADQSAAAGATDQAGAPDQQQKPPAKPAPEQATPPPQTGPPTGSASSRQAAIEQGQAAKVPELHPYQPNKAERIFEQVDTILQGGTLRWHPFFDSAYSGGGFTLGVGHINYVSAYNYIDVRGSWTFSNYKRVEAEFVAPRLFNRRGKLSVLGGWREATQVGFYGIGNDTITEDKTNYLFNQPYGSALLTLYPTRNVLMLQGGVELSRWKQEPGTSSLSPSVETVYTPATLPGLGAEVTYLHTQGAVGLDWRTSPGYTRRGAYIAATLHDYKDNDDNFGFQLAEYEGIAHLPILREAWVLSFHARVQTVFDKDNEDTPFFMLPALGGGSSLRGYPSWRWRDKNSLLLQGEWRIMVNRYLDTAVFYDAGKVAARTSDLDLDHLHSDFGFGVRFHGPFATPLRVELAKGKEGLSFIFASSASF
jgi:Omp85 superfamily domain